MPIQTPFSFNFSCPEGTNKIQRNIVNARSLKSFFAYVEDDNKGPVYINAYITIYGSDYPIVSGSIFDSEGPNRKILNWQGSLPIRSGFTNILTIEYSNYCGEDIDLIKVGGVVER